MSHLIPIYDVWDGNAEAMAADIAESGVTVRQWRNRGNIPPQYWPKIIEAAVARGKHLNWRQFVPPERPRQAEDHGPDHTPSYPASPPLPSTGQPDDMSGETAGAA